MTEEPTSAPASDPEMLNRIGETLSRRLNEDLRKHGLNEGMVFGNFVPDVARKAILELCGRTGDELINDIVESGGVSTLGPQHYAVLYIGALRKLASDDRMKPAYALLLSEFDSQAQWSRFFDAHGSAMLFDSDATRLRIEQAKKIRSDMIKAAGSLHKALSELHALAQTDEEDLDLTLLSADINIPPKLLLRVIDENDLVDVAQDVTDRRADEISTNLLEVLAEASGARRSLYARQPRPVDVARIVFEAAQQWAPAALGFDQAVMRRTRSRLEPVRAVGWRLDAANDVKEFDIVDGKVVERAPLEQIRKSTNLIKAVAIAVTVVLDDPETDFTYDDVRKALESWTS